MLELRRSVERQCALHELSITAEQERAALAKEEAKPAPLPQVHETLQEKRKAWWRFWSGD